MKDMRINTKNIHVIPIGSYIDIYDNKISKQQAREKLAIPNNDFVFLYFGLIKKYKGVEELLDTFIKLLKKNKNIMLIIAGSCNDATLFKKLDTYKNKYKDKLIINTKFILNDEVQYYFNAANIVVSPFRKVTTTSTPMVALSFSKPVIAPRLGSLLDLPENVGYFYDKTNDNGLYESMLKAIVEKNTSNIKSSEALKYVKSLSWEKIATMTDDLYKSLFIS